MANARSSAMRASEIRAREPEADIGAFGRNPANQNDWLARPEFAEKPFLGSMGFWLSLVGSAAIIGLAFIDFNKFGLAAVLNFARELSTLSVLLQPLMLVVMVWAIGFVLHRSRMHDRASQRLMRASDRLFAPSDRVFDEISNLHEAVGASLEIIEQKIYEVSARGDHLQERLYEVFKEISLMSEANQDDVKAIIEQAEERRHFLQHANMMITSEANYELERNSANVKQVLQNLKTEIDSFMARLSKDTATMREIVDVSASEAEVVKVITEDLRAIVNSSYHVIQAAVEEGRSSMEHVFASLHEQNADVMAKVGDQVIQRLQEHADSLSDGLQSAGQKLEEALTITSERLLATLEEKVKESAKVLENSTADVNEAALVKLSESISELHVRTAQVVLSASEDIDGKLADLLQVLDDQRIKAINQITNKMATMPESMKSVADEALEQIEATIEQALESFKNVAQGVEGEARSAGETIDGRIEQVRAILSEIQNHIASVDTNVRRGFDESDESFRKSGESTRRAIASIKSDYMALLSQTMAQLNAMSNQNAPVVLHTPPQAAAPDEALGETQGETQSET